MLYSKISAKSFSLQKATNNPRWSQNILKKQQINVCGRCLLVTSAARRWLPLSPGATTDSFECWAIKTFVFFHVTAMVALWRITGFDVFIACKFWGNICAKFGDNWSMLNGVNGKTCPDFSKGGLLSWFIYFFVQNDILVYVWPACKICSGREQSFTGTQSRTRNSCDICFSGLIFD